ncbi:magnesium/cobalt transporter CorA [Candidatus Bathyarchaeota archaeon]|nr:magnesium/cobalt transporter CorA [Candidatus Bathyarchaeota archaeon]
MAGLIKGRSRKSGLPPGAKIYVGEDEPLPALIDEISYDREGFLEKQIEDASEIVPSLRSEDITWIRVRGLDPDVIFKIGEEMGFHPLTREDIINTTQRPKVEEYDDYIFFVLKVLNLDSAGDVGVKQVSFILGSNYLISFQEGYGDLFESIRQRIRSGKGIIRRMGVDYLGYCLLDIVVDGYFVILEKLGDGIEALEEELVENPQLETLHRLYEMKRDMVLLRKNIWPLREVISRIERLESGFFAGSTRIYLRDVYDHTIQVIDAIETYRDLLTGMIDIYLSSVSNRMNEIMKFLTIIGTIFIPLTFLAGVYGMNFKYMPELGWRYSYPALLFSMLAITMLMVVYFRKKKWL